MKFISLRLSQVLPFYYGYVMLLLAMLMQIGSCPGQTFAISAFTPAILDDLPLTEAVLGKAYMLGTLLAAMPLVIVGPLSDRIGLRIVSICVAIGLGLACIAASMATGFFSLLFAFFLLRFLGQGSMTLLSSNATSMWFEIRLGRMTALISVGTALAFAWVPELLQTTIDYRGWRETFGWLAALLLLGLLPLILVFFCSHPEEVQQSLDGKNPADSADAAPAMEASIRLSQAARTGTYYILAASTAIWAMTGTGIIFFLFNLCEERGLPEGTAADFFKTFGLSMLVLQLAGGVAADYVKLNRQLGVGVSLLAAGLAVACVAGSAWEMHLFAILFGAGQGLLISTTGVIWARFYGRKFLGSIRGTVWCATVAGSGIGPYIMGWFKDSYGSFEFAIYTFLILMVPLAIASWWTRSPLTAKHDLLPQAAD